MAVPMASSAKVVTFGGFKRCVASFRKAGVALCDIPACFIICRNLFFFVAGAMLCVVFRRCFRGRRSTLETSIVMSRGRRNTSGLSCWVFFANRIVRAASGDSVRCDEN